MKQRLIIIHGFMATPHNHWFQWLKTEAEKLDMHVSVPAMPEPESPDVNKWLNTIESTAGQSDENTWFVGHSLGCITILRYLTERCRECKAAGVIMVSGFSETVECLEVLSPFTDTTADLEQVVTGVKYRAVLASLNDDIVPPEKSLRLSQQLLAEFCAIPDSGHFLDRDGYKTLPSVFSFLQRFTGYAKYE